MNITVHGGESRIKLTKTERKLLEKALDLLTAIGKYDDKVGSYTGSLKKTLGRIAEDGTYTPKEDTETE